MSSDSMRAAVVIPSFNHERYIERAIRSVLDQTRPPDRFIIIDDGSSDATAEIAAQFRDRRVEVVTQTNAGAHNALNRGIAMAAESADLIAILNSDDEFAPERLARTAEFFAANDSAAVLSTGIDLIDGESSPLPDDHPRTKWFRAAWSAGHDPNVDLPAWLGTANFPATTSNIVARAAYLKSNPFRPYRYCHDYYLLVKAALEDKLAVIPDQLVRYRVHGANTIDTDPAPLMREMLRMHLDLYREIGYETMAQQPIRERFSRYIRATWNNVSAFHAGLFQTLLARLASAASEDEVQEVAVVLGESSAPELASFPNKQLVNSYSGDGPLRVDADLAGRIEKLLAERRALKQEIADLKEIARIRRQLLSSKRAAFGIVLGKCPEAATDRGKTSAEKRANLEAALENSQWLKWQPQNGPNTPADPIAPPAKPPRRRPSTTVS